MENDYGKIFAEVLDIINNSEKEDWDNNISEETKEILALIYRDYIVSPEERKELIRIECLLNGVNVIIRVLRFLSVFCVCHLKIK